MKQQQTITLTKQNQYINIYIDILINSDKSYSYTVIDSKNVNRVYYTSDSCKLFRLLERLYDRKFTNCWERGS